MRAHPLSAGPAALVVRLREDLDPKVAERVRAAISLLAGVEKVEEQATNPLCDAGGVAPRDRLLLPTVARAYDFRNPLAFRRWCRSRGVPIEKDGRREWVRIADVEGASAVAPRGSATKDIDDGLAAYVAAATGGSRTSR